MKPTNAKLAEQFVDFINLTDEDLEEINVPELGRIQGGWGFSCGSCGSFAFASSFASSCGSCFGFSCGSCFDFGFSCGSCFGFSCGSCFGFGFSCGSCF